VFPGFVPGLVITHINGEDITVMGMKDIGAVIVSRATCAITMPGYAESAARHGGNGGNSVSGGAGSGGGDYDDTPPAPQRLASAPAASVSHAQRQRGGDRDHDDDHHDYDDTPSVGQATAARSTSMSTAATAPTVGAEEGRGERDNPFAPGYVPPSSDDSDSDSSNALASSSLGRQQAR